MSYCSHWQSSTHRASGLLSLRVSTLVSQKVKAQQLTITPVITSWIGTQTSSFLFLLSQIWVQEVSNVNSHLYIRQREGRASSGFDASPTSPTRQPTGSPVGHVPNEAWKVEQFLYRKSNTHFSHIPHMCDIPWLWSLPGVLAHMILTVISNQLSF